MKCSRLYLFLGATLLALSCRPDEMSGPDGGRYANLDALSHEQIVLGDQLEDPYSLDIMQQSLEVLYPTKAGAPRLEVTDYYVRFLPEDDTQFKILKLMDVNLLDHPLDYEIIREGDYYHDPAIEEGNITWQYAVVPRDFQFPQDIRYEILDRCFIPENTATKASDVDWEAVEREAYRLSGNEKMLLPRSKAGEEGDGRPRGSIVIIDDKYNGGEPVGVSGVMVSVNSFVKFSSAYTDASGSYTIPKSFSSEIRYRLVFQNQKGFGIGVNLLLVPASVSTLGSGPASGINVLIDKDSNANFSAGAWQTMPCTITSCAVRGKTLPLPRRLQTCGCGCSRTFPTAAPLCFSRAVSWKESWWTSTWESTRAFWPVSSQTLP